MTNILSSSSLVSSVKWLIPIPDRIFLMPQNRARDFISPPAVAMVNNKKHVQRIQAHNRSVAELEKTQLAAREMEEKMLQAERQREELEEVQRNAEESRRLAEETANSEKAERELKVSSIPSLTALFTV